MQLIPIGAEAHGHCTWTEITPWNSADQQHLAMMQQYVEDTLFSAQTLGQASVLLEAWANIQ